MTNIKETLRSEGVIPVPMTSAQCFCTPTKAFSKCRQKVGRAATSGEQRSEDLLSFAEKQCWTKSGHFELMHFLYLKRKNVTDSRLPKDMRKTSKH